GIDGYALSISARVYGIGDIAMPYNRGQAWVFRGATKDKAVMLAFVHSADAADDQRLMLRGIVESFVIGPPPDGASATEAPVAAFPLPDASPVAEVIPDKEDTGAVTRTGDPSPPQPASFDNILTTLNLAHGGDCSVVDVQGLNAFSVMSALSLAPDAAALCAASGTAIAFVTLPQDPRKGQTGPLGRAYMRIFLAQGRTPLLLVDQAHGAVVSLTATGGAGIAVDVSDL